jgi:hypothetical protein
VFQDSFVEVCVTLHWSDCSKWIAERHDQYDHVASAIVAIACWQRRPLELVLLNSFFGSLSIRVVSIENRIGAEGANALGEALKDNTTLTSLSLSLYGE